MPTTYKDDGFGVTEFSLKFFERIRKNLGHVVEVTASFKPLRTTPEGSYYTILRDHEGNEVWLSGCTAGYHGAGPNGTRKLLKLVGLPVPSRLYSSKRKPVVIPSAAGKKRDHRAYPGWLRAELQALQEFFDWGKELKVEWDAGAESELEGEVVGNIIHIYSKSRQDSIETLRHEYLDRLLSSAIEPYADIANFSRYIAYSQERHTNLKRGRQYAEATNLLTSDREEKAYRQKEFVIEKLSLMLAKLRDQQTYYPCQSY